MNQNHLCYHYTTREKLYRIFGGDDRVRTDDPHNAIVVLFQLSYIPKKVFKPHCYYLRVRQRFFFVFLNFFTHYCKYSLKETPLCLTARTALLSSSCFLLWNTYLRFPLFYRIKRHYLSSAPPPSPLSRRTCLCGSREFRKPSFSDL